MRIEVLGSYGGESLECRMTCLLINGTVALDAGSLSQALPIERQVAVRSIVLTHSHMDHTSGLPFFIENVFGRQTAPIDIYASAATIYSIRKYLFNNATWPDFSRLPNQLLPAMRFHELEPERPITIDGVTFTPIPVSHPVPTFGYLLEQGNAAVLWSSDTGPTQRLWEVANATRNLRALAIETSFDNSLQDVADLSQHLTPQSLDRELRKFNQSVPVYVHHLKPPCLAKVRQEVEALGRPNVDFLEQGRIYEF